MACAGYLVRNNTKIVYAEIANGLLVCTAAAQHRAAASLSVHEGDGAHDTVGAGASLPLLAPKRMERAASFIVDKLKRRSSLSDVSTQPEDEPLDSEEAQQEYDHATTTKQREIPYEAPRVVQLSGHVVEVADCADEAADSAMHLMPFSFRVKTKKMTLHADASYSFTAVDTLLLAAPDRATKEEWMRRLARWNRYGWRDTSLLAASDEDADVLEIALQKWRDSEEASVMKPSTLVFGYAAASATTRSSTSRRRFYRHTGSVSAGYAPLDTTSGDGDENAWFQTRVVNTRLRI